jgi:hypothetical protein
MHAGPIYLQINVHIYHQLTLHSETHVKCCHGACGVVGDQFHVHAEVPEEIRQFRIESRSCVHSNKVM